MLAVESKESRERIKVNYERLFNVDIHCMLKWGRINIGLQDASHLVLF